MQNYLALQKIENEMPYISDKITLIKVNFDAKNNKAYFLFESTILVDEPEFLKIEKILQSMYRSMKVAVRIASPSLGKDFLKDINAYKQVLERFLMRSTDAARAWIKDVGWELESNRIMLTCPDEYAENFFRKHNFDEKLKQAIWDIFRIEIPVVLIVAGEREAWINKIRSMRVEFNGDNSPELLVEEQVEAVAPVKEKPKRQRISKPKEDVIPKQELLYGKAMGGVCSPVSSCTEDAGQITVCGTIDNIEKRELPGGKTLLLKFTISDNTGSVYSKCFFNYGIRGKAKKEDGSIDFEELKRASRQNINTMVDNIKSGDRMLLSGHCVYDSFLREPCINVKSLSRMPKDIRMDDSEEKRVELHLHTQMSAMDAVSPAVELIERAAKWGHKAIAITDHGVVQAYPAAFAAAKKHKIKLIPGCELYMCDYAVPIKNANNNSLNDPIVVLDFETTGLSTNHDRIIEIGAVKLVEGTIVDTFSTLVNPGTALSSKITEITGITDIMLVNMPKPEDAVEKLLTFIGDSAIAAHNAPFDMGMLNSELKRMGKKIDNQVIDTLVLARSIYPDLKSYRLKALCKNLGVVLQNAHRAVHDATATAQCLAVMFNLMIEQGNDTFIKVNEALDKASFGTTNHLSVLVSKQEGLKNLYYLISQGHLKYFQRNMRVPRFEVETHRDGLLLGSSCSSGELFQAALYGAKDEELEKIAKFYDYIEIMPLDNNAYLVRENLVKNYDEIKQINIRLYNLGEKLGIPVVATGDVHFTDPQDSIYRAILKASMNYSDFDKQEPLYLKTTDEMLDAFKYLGEEIAHKVVIDNTNLVADMIDNIRQYPKHPDGEFAVTFQPFWPDAEDNIRNSAMGRAKEYYGYPYPDIVQKRLDKELKSILGYGFGTLYNIAQKLVKKSNDDGYVVGSRGSVGSSFVATMCGITEVNPLPPHYRCGKCSHSDFNVPKEFTSGIDLPDMLCPKCGEPMIKDGYNIPFEVFLGFEGDKVPDIDLNFSGEYQAKAHAYVEELFGSDFVYRAGTISAMAEKTAFGYVSKYLELKGTTATRTHKERLARGLMGVKRTTGQHPGGIVVLPKEYSIYDFTPIQHPADDSTGNTITTHFDFTSMHDILVKLDILGHDDPTMLHDLEHLTGIKYTDIPLDDKKVMSLFTSPEALGVTAEDILSPTGTLGIPEFGTGFVQNMLMQTQPSTMDELLRISGLSHGTDVWAGNTEEIIKRGDAKLSECICTRDDIMNALISYGLDNKLSFDTMERVRKGRGLPDETVDIMKENNVPDWFIGSCQKIKYMFPKAHACAYVIMALRIAYYKVYHPLQYYAAYFTIRSVGFDSSTMILSNEVLKEKIENYEKTDGRAGRKLTPTEKDELYALRMTLEMQSRGINFLKADIYKSDSRLFLPEGNALRVPFNSLPGLGTTVAEGIVAARNDEPFNNIEDLKERAHIGNSMIEMLKNNGVIEGLPDSAQMDMFSLLGL